jgi:N-acetylglucosamine-6-phosphate deacetylase
MKEISIERFFDGEAWKNEVVVTLTDDKKTIINISHDGYQKVSAVHLMIPAFIDLQIYGAYGKLLSEFPNVDSIKAIRDYSRNGGAAFFQPTIASQSIDVIKKSIDAVRDYQKEIKGKENSSISDVYYGGCLGLHLEGPWINPKKRGAHSLEFIHSPSLKEVKDLLDYGKDIITMITLAPEVCDLEVIKYITEHSSVILSAGHSDASYEEAVEAFKSFPTCTHLFNAMSPFHHRQPGLAGAILDHSSVMSSVVVDGYHVDFAAVRVAKKVMGERLYCITDAVTATNSGPYQHYLVEENRYENQGILSGSALTQVKSISNLVNNVGIELGEAIRMCSVYPARVMKYSHREKTICSPKIGVGSSYPFIFLNASLDVVDCE